MPATQVRTQQIGDGTVARADLNTSVSGSAVIAKAVQGTLIALTSTGADAGTGDVTISIATIAANSILANATGGAATPQAITINANTIVGRAAIGSVQSLTLTSPLLITGTALTLDVSQNFNWTAAQTITVTDTETAGASTPALIVQHQTTGTPANALGAVLAWNCETSTQPSREQGRIATGWSDVADGTRTAYMDFLLVNNAALPANKMRLFPSGGLSVNTTADPGAGYVNANTGFKIAGTDIFPLTAARGGVPSGGAAGTGLYKNTATNYDYNWKQPASFQTASPGINTAGTASTAGVHAGLAGSITPTTTGRIHVIIAGYMNNSAANFYTGVNGVRYGTGGAPAHGAALTGTAANGNTAIFQSATAAYFAPFCVSTIITGLTIGTAYWLDAAYLTQNAGGTAKLFLTCVTALEF